MVSEWVFFVGLVRHESQKEKWDEKSQLNASLSSLFAWGSPSWMRLPILLIFTIVYVPLVTVVTFSSSCCTRTIKWNAFVQSSHHPRMYVVSSMAPTRRQPTTETKTEGKQHHNTTTMMIKKKNRATCTRTVLCRRQIGATMLLRSSSIAKMITKPLFVLLLITAATINTAMAMYTGYQKESIRILCIDLFQS